MNVIMLSAMYENGGNTTHRLLDGHPNLFVYPFESQVGTGAANDFLTSYVPIRYRWPEFGSDVDPTTAYEMFWDEELKTLLRVPGRSKFKDCGLKMDEMHGSVAPLLELGAGMHPELTGRENIVLNGLLMGYSKAEMLAKSSKIIDFAEIGEFIDAPVKQYSSGMYTRLAFAVATEVDPQVLIIDEILAVGDIKFQAKCLDRLHTFRRSNKTILLVSHALDHVLSSCDRAIVLEGGEVVKDDVSALAVADFKQRMGIAEEEVEMLTGIAASH